MILSITALIASILALSYQIYTNRKQDRKWDEYFENERNLRKNRLIKMMQDDAKDGLCQDDEIIIKNKIKGSVLLKPKEEYQRKAKHIVETVVKPQVKNYENKKRNEEKEYYAALGTMILITAISITLIIQLIFRVWN